MAASILSVSGNSLRRADLVQQVGSFGLDEDDQLRLETLHVLHWDVVDEAVGRGVDGDHLLLDRDRGVLGLLEDLGQAVTAVQLGLRHLVQLGAERRERLEITELGQVGLEGPGHGPHGPDLGRAADPRHRVTDVDGRPDTGVEEVGLEEHLTIGDGDHVGRDVGRDVAGLGLDDRQGGERSSAHGVRQLGRALQQPAVQVEDVAGIGLPAGRTAQQQRQLAIGLGLLRQVVVDDEGVLAVLHPVLADGRAGSTAPGT